ncbi:FG-GAP-like repeat-containing protein, partial [Bacteroidota bacterium]
MKKIKYIFLVLFIGLLSINAKAQVEPPPLPEQQNCVTHIVPNNAYYATSGAGSFDIDIYTESSSCNWTVDVNCDWGVSVLKTSGQGNDFVRVNYPENTTSSSRSASIIIGSEHLTIYQSAPGGGDGGDGDDDDDPFCPPITQIPQKSITLLTPIDDQNCYIHDGVIEARDYVRMKGSFVYSTESGDAPVTITVSPDMVFPADYNSIQVNGDNRTIDKTLEVGSLSGSINVSPSGAAVYSIPIPVPQGTAGMQPNLSITYNSQQGRTNLGKGFNISGLSTITRVPQNNYYDGHAEGLQFDNDDRFALDGQRLMMISTPYEYGTPHSKYRSEQNSFADIEIFGSISEQYFEVETKDGKTLEYGNSISSKIKITDHYAPYAFYLNKITDSNGNFMTYEYKEENGEVMIEKINYTGNSGLSPYNTVYFYYDERSDQKSYYIVGAEVTPKHLLREIVVQTNNRTVRRYNFKYVEDDISESILTEIIESNKSGAKLNKTIINWGDLNANNITQNTITIPPYSTVQHKDMDFYSMDVNEDGLSDLVSTFHYNPGDGAICRYNTYLANVGSNNNYSFVYSSPLSDDFGTYTENDYHLGTNIGPLFGDLTGSGSNDVIIPKIYTYVNGNADLSFLIPLKDWDYELCLPCIPLYSIADFDQDGRDNLIYLEVIETDGYYNGAIMEVIGNLGQNMESIPISLNLNSEPKNLFVGDYNSDGLVDLRVTTETKIYTYLNNNGSISATAANITTFTSIHAKYFKQGDFNGDGLSDLLIIGENDENMAVAYGNGTANTCSLTLESLAINGIEDPDTHQDDDKDNCIIMDFNNDGLSDFILFEAKYKWDGANDKDFDKIIAYWYKSTGTGFSLVKQAESTIKDQAYKNFYVSGDFTGDGRQDLLNYGFDCYNQSSTTTLFRYYKSLNLNFEANKVKAIYDGFNNKTEIKYRPLSHWY